MPAAGLAANGRVNPDEVRRELLAIAPGVIAAALQPGVSYERLVELYDTIDSLRRQIPRPVDNTAPTAMLREALDAGIIMVAHAFPPQDEQSKLWVMAKRDRFEALLEIVRAERF